MSPLTERKDFILDLGIKNHAAMAALTRGEAARPQIDTLIGMANICEALYRMGFGVEHANVVQAGADALFAVGNRGAQTGKFILKADEMHALNALLELHDAQLGVITVKEIETAFKIVKAEYAAKRMRRITSQEQA